MRNDRIKLETRRWQVEQIHKSLRQADDGKLVSHAKVKQMARKWLCRLPHRRAL